MNSEAETMVERIAKALHERFNTSGYADYTYPWGHPLASMDMFRDLARAVLTALLDPTEEMVEAGRAAWLKSASYYRIAQAIDAAFRAMIQAALQPGSKSQ